MDHRVKNRTGMLARPQNQLAKTVDIQLAKSSFPESNGPLSGGLTVAFLATSAVTSGQLRCEQQHGIPPETERVCNGAGMWSNGQVHGDSQGWGAHLHVGARRKSR